MDEWVFCKFHPVVLWLVAGGWVAEWLEALRVASVELYRPRTTDVQQQERLV